MIRLSGVEFRKSRFADDTSLIIDGSVKSFETLVRILEGFIYISGLKLNAKKIIKEIEKIMYAFIWEGKPEKIKREILIQDYENGGLKIIDLEMFIMSLKISWLKRISVSENNRTIYYIYLEKLKHVSGKLFFSPDDVNSVVLKTHL